MIEFIAVIGMLIAGLLFVCVEVIYPMIVKRNIKKTETHIAESFVEYRTNAIGYIGTLYPLILCVSFLCVFIELIKTEKRIGWEDIVLISLLTIGVIWFVFKLVYILPRRYFKWENNVIYYHTGLREKVITEIKHIFRRSSGRTNYFSVEIWEDKKPNVYVDILSLQHPKRIYSILKVKSKAENEFY